MTEIVSLPCELVDHIRSYLPLKSLLRFRCVSKEWRSVIDELLFAQFHVSHSKEVDSNCVVILLNLGPDRRSPRGLYFADLENIISSHEKKVQNIIDERKAEKIVGSHVRKVDFPPFLLRNSRAAFIASSNGLICMEVCGEYLIWNASTKQYRVLSPSIRRKPITSTTPDPFPYISSSIIAHCFGYDSIRQDYELVLVYQSKSHDELEVYSTEISIYSFKNNSWRVEIGDDSLKEFRLCLLSGYRHHHYRQGVLVNGRAHWLSKFERCVYALEFDLGNGTTQHCSMSKLFLLDRTLALRELVVLGGCLCVVARTLFTDTVNRHVTVWVMNDQYGDGNSWTQLFSIPVLPWKDDNAYNLKPLSYSRNKKKVLLQANGRLFWYDLTRRTVLPKGNILVGDINSGNNDDYYYAYDVCVLYNSFVEVIQENMEVGCLTGILKSAFRSVVTFLNPLIQGSWLGNYFR